MCGSTDHVVHNFADSYGLVALSCGIEEVFEYVKCPVHELFTEFLYKASHTGKAHLNELLRITLDVLEDDMN